MDLRVPVETVMTAFGVPAIVTLPNEYPLPPTTGIWSAFPLDDDRPVGTDFQRREPRRVFSLPRSVTASMPRGALIEAPEVLNGPVKTWRVDGLARPVDPEFWHVIVILAVS